MKKAIKRGAALSMALALMLQAAPLAHAAQGPDAAPAVDSLTLQPGQTQASINLNWYAPEGTTSAQVKFGDQVVTATVSTLTAPTKVDENKYTDTGKLVCKATVTGLTPDTQYTYQISNDGGKTWSQAYTYRTADEDRFVFAFTSDPRSKRTSPPTAMAGSPLTTPTRPAGPP